MKHFIYDLVYHIPDTSLLFFVRKWLTKFVHKQEGCSRCGSRKIKLAVDTLMGLRRWCPDCWVHLAEKYVGKVL